MKKFLFVLISMATLAMAEESKPVEPLPQAMNETEVLKVENLRLQEQLIKATRESLIAEICGNHGIDIKSCIINPQTNQVMKSTPAVAPEIPGAKKP